MKKREPTAVPRYSLEFLHSATRILLALAAVAESRRTGTRDDALPFSTMLSSVLQNFTSLRHFPLPLFYLFFTAWLFLKVKQSLGGTSLGLIVYVGLCEL